MEESILDVVVLAFIMLSPLAITYLIEQSRLALCGKTKTRH